MSSALHTVSVALPLAGRLFQAHAGAMRMGSPSGPVIWALSIAWDHRAPRWEPEEAGAAVFHRLEEGSSPRALAEGASGSTLSSTWTSSRREPPATAASVARPNVPSGGSLLLEEPPTSLRETPTHASRPSPGQLCSSTALPVSLSVLELSIQCHGFFQPVFVVC